jgi:trimeric autotransporter adhesin
MNKIYTVFLTISTTLLMFVGNVNGQTYTTLPFVEHFDKVWVNNTNTRDVPSKYWKNTPATTDSSWSRDDDGVNRSAWQGLKGSYSPAGANGTEHSARFHTYDAIKGKSGMLDLYVNFSGSAGAKTLTFYYINPTSASAEKDSLQVYISTDGTTFTKINSQKNVSVWTLVTVNLGAVTAANGIIRFKATSDYGNTDMGIDEVSVFLTTNPPVISYFTSNLTNGNAPFSVNFTDQSTGTPTSWKWDFNNDGVIDSYVQNPSYTFNSGIYTVKLITSNASNTDTIIKQEYIMAKGYASLPFKENFEMTWKNDKGVRDIPSSYWTNTPATGNNSWSWNDDGIARGAWYHNDGLYTPSGANGTGHSARFHTYETTLSGTLDLSVNFSTVSGNKGLSFWYNNADGADSLKVYLSTDC